jgi:anti-sigma factor RsiW
MTMHIPTEQFSLALDRQLSADDLESMRQHLGSCAGCRREWELWQNIALRFQHAPMMAPPPGFARRLEERLTRRADVQRGVLGSTVLLTGLVTLWSLVAMGALMLLLTWLTVDPTAAGSLVAAAVRLAQTTAPLTSLLGVLLDGVQRAPGQLILVTISAAVLLAAATWGHLVLRYRSASVSQSQS